MTKDEILSMALSVVPDEDQEDAQGFDILRLTYSEIERFAALVAEKATEQANARQNASWARMCEKMVAAEREECAKVLEAHPSYDWNKSICEAVAAIRARGNND